MKMALTISKKGFPCLWERGGGMTKTGDATVIAGASGEPKSAIYVRSHGPLSCCDHALIPVKRGDYVISAEYGHGMDYFHVYNIENIHVDVAEC